MRTQSTGYKLWLVSAITLAMTGCFSEKPFGETVIGGNPGGGPSNPPAQNVNHAPTISGSPTTALRSGEAYSFQPSASDPDGDTLSFVIENRPVWAAFDQATGRLNGVPDTGDVGQFTDVRITVRDGRGAQDSLRAFRIDVLQVALGSVTLSWTPPTTNGDGSPMTDLAGYRIYYGRSSAELDQVLDVTNSGTTRFVVDNLAPATWYFSMTAVNSSGAESTHSSVVSSNLT